MTAEGNIYGVVNVRILPEFTGGCADSVVEKMTGNLEIAAEAVNGDPCGIQNLAEIKNNAGETVITLTFDGNFGEI